MLRSGPAAESFQRLDQLRLLELITPELRGASGAVWESLARLDRYRQRFETAPPELTNTILVGALLVPTGALNRPPAWCRCRSQERSRELRHAARRAQGHREVAPGDAAAAATRRARPATSSRPQPAPSARVRRSPDVARGVQRCAGRRGALEAREASARAPAASATTRRTARAATPARRSRARRSRRCSSGRPHSEWATAAETTAAEAGWGQRFRARTRRTGRLYRMIHVAPRRTARPGASVTSGVRPTSTRLSNAFSSTNRKRMCAMRAATCKSTEDAFASRN